MHGMIRTDHASGYLACRARIGYSGRQQATTRVEAVTCPRCLKAIGQAIAPGGERVRAYKWVYAGALHTVYAPTRLQARQLVMRETEDRYPFLKPCPWQATTDSECSMMREREVAGTDTSIPWCDHHGEYIGE